MRGALGTVDRDYGIFNIILHHITDSHVIHHMFSKMPFYNAIEATKIVADSGVLGPYYVYDKTPWWLALWRCYGECWTVNGDDITFFESATAPFKAHPH